MKKPAEKKETYTYRKIIGLWNDLNSIKDLNNKNVLIAVLKTKRGIKQIVEDMTYPDGWITDKKSLGEIKASEADLRLKMEQCATKDGKLATKSVMSPDGKNIEVLDISIEDSTRIVKEHDTLYADIVKAEKQWRETYQEALDKEESIVLYMVDIEDAPGDQHNFMCIEELISTKQ